MRKMAMHTKAMDKDMQAMPRKGMAMSPATSKGMKAGSCPECMMGRKVEHHSPAMLSQRKVGKVMHEYKAGALHSGSKTGPKVTSRKQAIAIGMSEGRKAAHGGYK